MKTKLPWLLLAAVALMAATAGTTLVTQTAEDLRSSASCQKASGTAQQTITFAAPPPGCYWVIDNLENNAGATTAPVATNIITTSTGVVGTPSYYLTMPASATGVGQAVTYANGLRAPDATAITFVSNGAVTNVTFSLDACGHLVCR